MIDEAGETRTVFISISHDGEEHVWFKDEVATPADDLVLIGVESVEQYISSYLSDVFSEEEGSPEEKQIHIDDAKSYLKECGWDGNDTETKIFYALFENGDAIEFFGEDCNERGYIAMAKRNKFSVYYYDEETAREMANEDDADNLLIYSGLKKFFQERDEV